MARILVADDHSGTREILSRTLSEWNHTVILASNAADAVTVACAEIPDLILLDVRMNLSAGQDIDDRAGLEVANYLKARPDTSKIPIVALTGHLLIKDLRKLMADAGCVAFVRKPIIDYDEFGTIVQEALATGKQ
jgi:two-component system, cell cycle response regulator DivK